MVKELPHNKKDLHHEHQHLIPNDNRIKRLDELKQGQHGKIVSFHDHNGSKHADEPHRKLKRHLMSMGFVKGADIKLVDVAPLGDPLKIKVKGYDIALRKEEAEDIVVELSED